MKKIKTQKYIIGYRKGTLDLKNKKRLKAGKSFELNGTTSDFLIIPR